MRTHSEHFSVEALPLDVPQSYVTRVGVGYKVLAVIRKVQVFDRETVALTDEVGIVKCPNMVNSAAFLIGIRQKDSDLGAADQCEVAQGSSVPGCHQLLDFLVPSLQKRVKSLKNTYDHANATELILFFLLALRVV